MAASKISNMNKFMWPPYILRTASRFLLHHELPVLRQPYPQPRIKVFTLKPSSARVCSYLSHFRGALREVVRGVQTRMPLFWSRTLRPIPGTRIRSHTLRKPPWLWKWSDKWTDSHWNYIMLSIIQGLYDQWCSTVIQSSLRGTTKECKIISAT